MSYKNDIFKITFSGIMFSLVMFFQYIEKFMPLNMGWVKLNISILFILITFYVIGLKYAIILIILRFLVGPGLGSGYTNIGFWNHFILLTYDSIFMLFLIIIKKKTGSFLQGILIGIFGVSLLSGPLNGLLFVPVYFDMLSNNGFIISVNLNSAMQSYSHVKELMYFGVPSYWGGMFAVYTLASLIKFAIVGFIIYYIWQILLKTPYKKYIINSKI